MFKKIRFVPFIIPLLLLAGNVAIAQDGKKISFEQVRAILRKHCVTCHNSNELRGGLDLSSLDAIEAGSDSGPALIPGKPEESLLWLVSAHQADPKMPPNSPRIPQREIDLLQRWITEGSDMKNGLVSSGASEVVNLAMASASEDGGASDSKSQLLARESYFEPIKTVGRTSPVTSIAVHPVLPVIAVPGAGQALLFNVREQKWQDAIAFPEGEVTGLKFSQDGKNLFIAGGTPGLEGKVVGYEMSSGKRLFSVGDTTDVILAFDVSPDQSLVAIGGPKRIVEVIKIESGEIVATLKKHTDWILDVAFSPDGLLLATSDRFGGLQVWEASNGNEYASLRGHSGAVQSIAWDGCSDRLVSAGNDGTVREWDMHTKRQIDQFDAEIGNILDLTFSRDLGFAVVGRHPTVKRFKINEQESSSGFEKPSVLGNIENETTRLAWIPSENMLVAGDQLGSLTLMSTQDGSNIAVIKPPTDPALNAMLEQRLVAMKPDLEQLQQLRQKTEPRDVLAQESEGIDLGDLSELNRLQVECEQAIADAEASLEKLKELNQKLLRTLRESSRR